MATRSVLPTAFSSRGRQLWLVGGALRDRMLGLGGHDDDFATDALPDEVEEIARSLGLRCSTVGKRFGTIGVELDGRWSEITTFRGESYSGGTRWPDVRFGRSIDEDLARRDFTINAMAEDAFSGELRDPFGGREDLFRRIVRAVGDPRARFGEDPLRILRGIRFASQLDFPIEPETLAAMTASVGLIGTLSQERVTAELDRLLVGQAPGRGLRLLYESGALGETLPELATMPGCDQNRFHHLDVWGHTVATVEAVAVDGPSTRRRRWAALLHDVGKPFVRHRKPNGEWGFYGHETVGAEVCATLLHRLRVGRSDALTITLLVRRHMDRPNLQDGRSVRRFMSRCEGHWRDLLALKIADNASHSYDDNEYHRALGEVCERIEATDAERLRARSPLNGDDLVALFGREPGPWIRRIKERLSALVLDGELDPDDREGAERIARQIVGTG